MLGCGAASPAPASPETPAARSAVAPSEGASNVFPAPDNLAPARWRVLGPFAPEGASREAAFDHDYLAAIGGEAAARFDASTTIEVAGQRRGSVEREADATGVDLRALYKHDTDAKLAYAYGELEWPRNEVIEAAFGSDDGAAVWVNGQRVHRLFTASRGLNPDSDHFVLPLVAGTNRVLVKVENGTGGWGFALTLHDAEGKERARRLYVRRHLEQLELAPESGSFLLGDEFPSLGWGHGEQARIVFGDSVPSVRWFDPELNEAKAPAKPGRYLALVEQPTRDGYTHRTMLTFAKVAPGPLAFSQLPAPPFGEPPPLRTELFPTLSEAQRTELSRHMWRAFADYMDGSQNGAIARVAMAELAAHPLEPSEPAWLGSGFIRNAEQQLALRMQIEGRTPRRIEPPAALSPRAPELRVGSERDAGIVPGTVARLRGVAQDWLKQDPNGFVVLLARRGVVFMHEGFAGFARDQAFRPASIGKLIAGLTFARAVDQGLIGFDDPVSRVLPEWGQGGAASITFRHCFNHVAGLPAHGSHGGLFNPYLDNALLVQDSIFSPPLRRHHYNGDGYNLAGQALELITGKSIWRLLHDNVQKPFGEAVTQFDLGFGDRFTARYVAEIGQMLLQDGRYAGHRFFSPGFLARLKPERVAAHAPGFPDQALEWGIGQTWTPDPSSGPRDKGVLGPDVFGHGAASGSIFRVDPAHELVVVIGRDAFQSRGENERLATVFLQALAQGLGAPDHKPARPQSAAPVARAAP
jgi:CubicO group peptidase (beta-lactamase class C family)